MPARIGVVCVRHAGAACLVPESSCEVAPTSGGQFPCRYTREQLLRCPECSSELTGELLKWIKPVLHGTHSGFEEASIVPPAEVFQQAGGLRGLDGNQRDNQIRLGALKGERDGGRTPALHFCEIRAPVFVMVINSSR